MATLSVVIPTLNEEKNIRGCLETVKWADEIIIVDNFSIDRTVEICKEYTNKIYFSDGGDYGFIPYLQNIGITKATKDWILILDADVRVPEYTGREILKKIEAPYYNGYYLKHITYVIGKPLLSPYWTFKIMKLFRNGKGKFKCNCAHGAIEISGKLGEIHHPLLHYAHPNIATFINKMNLYTSQDARYIFNMKNGGLLSRSIKHINFYYLIIEPIFLFFYLYLYYKSFKDGKRGFIVSFLMMIYLFLERAKVWEIGFQNKD